MKNLHKYKIEKIVNVSNPLNLLHHGKNFKISNTPFGIIDRHELLSRNIYPFSFISNTKNILFIETEKVIPHNETAFFYMPMQREAQNVIPVPFIELEKLLSDISIDDNKLLFIHHPGRCGSTLLHKILGSNPVVESFSEDLILENLIWKMYNEALSFNDFKSIYISILKLLVIKWNKTDKKIISQKMCPYSHYFINLLFRMLPNSKHIYITRNPVEIAISFINFAQSIPGRHFPFEKRNLSNFFKLSFRNKNLDGNEGYKQYMDNNIIPKIISAIGEIDNIEDIVLRVILSDSYFKFIKNENTSYITYKELLEKELFFNKLYEFLNIDKSSHFNKDLYITHSHNNKRYNGEATQHFNLTDRQKKQYSLFAEHVRHVIETA